MSSDDIRAKRLARLAALGAQRESPSSSVSSSNVDVSVKKSKVEAKTDLPVELLAKLLAKLLAEPPKVKQQEVLPSKVPPAKPTPKPVTVKPTLSLEEDIAQFLESTLKDVFKVSLKPTSDGIFLESLKDDLKESNRLLSSDDIESIFMEVLTEIGAPKPYTPIKYLFMIYNESIRLKTRLSKKESNYDTKAQILSSIISFACNYGVICFQVSDMFINNDIKALVEGFINSINTMSGFLTDILLKSVEQEGLLDVLNLLVPTISVQLQRVNLSDPAYNKYLIAFKTLVDIKPVAAVFTQINGFQPPNPKESLDFEQKTLLGPLLSLSPLAKNVGKTYFLAGFNENNYSALQSSYDSMTLELKVVTDQLFEIVNKLIRGSPETRNNLMSWFAQLINVSRLRTGSHADPTKLASDAFMFNISIILIKLSEPFLDFPNYSKLDKIDINYLSNQHCLIDLTDEARVNSSIQEATEEFNNDQSDKPNFISDCFYLTLAYLHYGIGGISVGYNRLKDQIKQLKERIGAIENNQMPPNTNPMMMNYIRSQLPALNKRLEALNIQKHSVKAIFGYRDLQLEIFDFVVGATIFTTRVIDPDHHFPQKKLNVPIFKISKVSELDDQDFLKTKCPKPWKYFPEFFLEGIINYCKFTTNFRGSPLVSNYNKLEKFVEFIIVLIRCPEILGNPHTKSSIIEILFFGSLPMGNGGPGFITDIFNSNLLVKDNVLYSLLDLYVMVEKTGASSQFYDKFNSRYYISVILEELWKNEYYRSQLTKYSTENVDFFVRFIARMLNDTTYLLDETFNELNAIHNYQQELKKRQLGQPGNEEEFGSDEDIVKNLEGSERKAKSYMGLSKKTMELFKLFTKEVPRGFMLPELVDRLAGMMDYNLEAMVGPKASNLKVEDPTKYEFDPKATLQSLCQIYCNLSNQPEFVLAVARDGRSFNINWFLKAERILSTKTLTDSRTIKALVDFGCKADEQRQQDEDDELELGEIPDDFLDPLMYTLMEDPVILPSSKVTIDRSTIKAHLLSDSTDPFNRVPLKLEDVIDDVEMKQNINNWKKQKREEFRSNKMQVDS